MKTIQYGWKGRWYNMDGHGCADVAAMTAYVERANAREGYENMRVADRDTDRETGAPPRPIHDIVMLQPAETSEFLALVRKDVDAGLDAPGKARLNELVAAMKGPVIGHERHES